MPFLLLGCVLALAFFNGANDVSKGIATLVGSGVTKLKTAIVWGTLWTLAGGVTAAFAAQGLVKAFGGSSLISPAPDGAEFLIAVAVGALVWIGLATRTGMPVSTTHAITGSLIGVGLISVGVNGVQWAALLQKFVLPLAVSPVLALVLTFLIFPMLNLGVGRLQKYCVCVNERTIGFATQPPVAASTSIATVVVGQSTDCGGSPRTVFLLNTLDSLHWLTAGLTSFARGLNDTPKIFALGAILGATLHFSAATGFVSVALVMAAGGLLAGFRVTETLAQKVTRMSPAEGFSANLVTALLVIFASKLALPVSTTHVSTGAIIGLGLKRDARSIQWKTVREMLLAWIVTLPSAALIAAAVYWLLTKLHPA